MSSYSVPAPVATSRRSAPPSSARRSPSSRRSTGAGSASTSAASRARRCSSNAELAHVLTHEKAKFGIEGDAHDGLSARRTSAPATVPRRHRQGRPLPDEEEQDHRDRRLGHAHRRRRRWTSGPTTAPAAQLTFDNLIIAAGAITRMLPGRRAQRRTSSPTRSRSSTTTLPGSIIIAGSGAIGVEFAYVMKNFGVDVTIVEFLDRMVPTEDADVSKELLKHYKKLGVKVLLGTKVEGVEDTGSGRPGHRRPGGGRRPAGARGRQVAAGHRLRAAGRGLRPRVRRRRAHRARRDRDRRLLPHQRPQHLRHRRRAPAS